jgi:hypothetical protein
MANYSNAALATADLASTLAPAVSRAPVRKAPQTAVLRDTAPPSARETLPPKTEAVYRPGLLSLLIGKFVAAHQRAADREIARYLESTGGKFTDSIEREIQRRLM